MALYTHNGDGSGWRVLLAEDDRNLAFMLKGELEDDGFIVMVACDGDEAVQRFVDDHFDAVILDINMPRMNGIDALKEMKKTRPKVFAVAISGDAGEETFEEAMQAGASRCFGKPFELKELKDCIAMAQLYR